MRHHLNQAGSALIQVMVACVLLAVVALGFSSMMSSMFSAQGTAQVRQNITMLTMDLQATFGNEIACQRSLVPGTAFNLTQAQAVFPSASALAPGLPFQFRLNNTVIQQNEVVPGYDLMVNRFALMNALPGGQDKDHRPVYRVNLVGQFSPSSPLKGGLQEFKTINLAAGYVSVSGGTIANCSSSNLAVAESGEQTCESLGGTYDVDTKKCQIDPNLEDPAVAKTICVKLGGKYASGKCNFAVAANESGASGLRWWRVGTRSNYIKAGGPGKCKAAPSAGAPCSEEGLRCYWSETNSGAMNAGAANVMQNAEWACN